MKALIRNFIALLALGCLANGLLTQVALAQTLSFSYTNAADGNLTANFTIDVVGGYAVSGTGTATSSLWIGTDNLNLVTYQATLPAGDGSINVTNSPVAHGFTWHTVPGSTGPDFIVDNAVLTPAPLYFDEYGIVFSINNPSTKAIVGGLNIFDQGPPDGVGYSDNLSAGGTMYSYAGTGALTLAPVPEPETCPLILGGLALAAWATRRKAARP